MRVIAGRWKGRPLRGGHGLAMRPTTDRVKEAVFSILSTRIKGAEVTDLYCGAGGLGIEALSRGAALVHFVDMSPTALSLTRRNLEVCQADPASFLLSRAEALRWLAVFVAEDRCRPVVVLADPPYGTDGARRVVSLLQRTAVDFPLGAAIVEHGSDAAWEPLPSGRFPWRRRSYGTTTLTILEG